MSSPSTPSTKTTPLSPLNLPPVQPAYFFSSRETPAVSYVLRDLRALGKTLGFATYVDPDTQFPTTAYLPSTKGSLPDLPFSIDGENLILTTNTSGVKKLLIGTLALKQALEELPDIYSPSTTLRAVVQDAEITAALTEMKALGIPYDMANERESALVFIARRNAVCSHLAASFGVNSEDIIVLREVLSSLHSFILPGTNPGQILLQDYRASATLLKTLAIPTPLTKEEHSELFAYREACEENQALNPFIDHTHRILSAHGFTVVPTPAIFSAPGKGINFLQALTGKAPSTKTPFFITTGVSTGSALGTHLMEAFKLFLLNLDPSTSVHFIGKDPDGSFTTVMGLWDKHLAGIRTLAFPVDPM